MSLDLNCDSPDATASGSSEEGRGGLLVLMGAKGGCGATLVACNAAAALAADRKVVLVDLDLTKGDVAGTLDLQSGRSINSLLARVDELDDALLQGSVDVHSSGLHVLAQPYDLTRLHQLDADEVRSLLRVLQLHYDLVVVDAGSRIDVATLAAATTADELVLLSTPDVPAIRDARRVIRLLEQLEVPAWSVRLVINKQPMMGGPLSIRDIEDNLQAKVAATISRNDRVCARVDARGSLLTDEDAHAAITQDVRALWSKLRGTAAPAPTTGSILPRFLQPLVARSISRPGMEFG